MRQALLALVCGVVAVGCAPASYAYRFDLADVGAINPQRVGERATIEDADVRAELLVDPTAFQAILLELTNKTIGQLEVEWHKLSIVGPDHIEAPIRADTKPSAVQSGAKIITRLVPFTLPAKGDAAASYEGAVYELIVPVLLAGKPKVYRYHLVAHPQKL
jgi:hypothetical protein